MPLEQSFHTTLTLHFVHYNQLAPMLATFDNSLLRIVVSAYKKEILRSRVFDEAYETAISSNLT
jgi:hypothetical protein